jgi:predicted Zn-dependent peptidase
MNRPIVVSLALAFPLVLGSAAVLASPAPPPAVLPLRLTVPVSKTLPNGLRVVVFPSSAVPIVQAQLLVPAGSAEEPDTLPGLAAMAARIVQSGSSSRSAEQLAADLAAVGATFSTNALRDYALAACGSRSAAFEATLEIMADAVISPRIGEEAFDNARRGTLQQLQARMQNESAIADDRLWALAFDPHPYGHPDRGEPEALFGMSLDQVRAFVRDRWRPDRAVLAIAGDVTPERAFAAAADVFSRWSGSTSADRPRKAPSGAKGVHLLDLDGSPRAEVRVVVRAPGRGSPELPAWLVAAEVLEDRLARSTASVTLTPLHDASLLVLSQSAPAESARAVANRLLGALRGFSSPPPTAEVTKAAARRAAQAMPLTLETLGARLSRWQADDFAGLPADAVTQTMARLTSPAIDLAPVARALSAPPAIFAAGPADKLRPLLAPLGAITAVPLIVRRTSLPDSLPPPTEAELAAGRSLMAAVVTAHGGAKRLEAALSTVTEGEMGVEARGQKVEGKYSTVRVEPMRFSQSTKMMTFEVKQVLDGDEGWMLSVGDTASLAEADSSEVRAMRGTFYNDLVHLLRAASAAEGRAAKRGSETIDNRPCDLVDYTGFGGQRLRFAIDRETKRVVAADAGLGSDLRWHERRRFSEWKTVLGLLLPAFEERFLDGERVSYLRARMLTVNPKLDDNLFKKPMVVKGQLIPNR